MTIEEELFRKTKIDFNKISKYGFKKDRNLYKYSQNIMNDTFRVDIKIDNDGIVKGRVYDLSFGDEYTNFRIEDSTGPFVGQVRDEFENLLKDIRNSCFTRESFIYEQSNRITNTIKEKYGDDPEFIWEKLPGYGIFRNPNNRKWYGLIMNIDRSKLKDGTGEVEILNIKLDESKTSNLLKRKGFYPSYHMKKDNWITITLDNTIPDDEIMNYIMESHKYTEHSEEWIVPANPKYYDIINCFNDTDTIIWKQSSNIKVNDIVYMYVAEPYSAILYKCKAIEVNLPYEYEDKNLSIKKVMRIKLIKEYNKDEFNFSKLKEYGIKAIRGPRLITEELSKELNK